ncbi:hypothetical protein RF55_14513 [Lasius niger]|uniref:Uncharacterized protein n=1 Tax=Lasius niger TaxID=67767 RepID=A0A0J7K7N5_LASNI|nr:hypothetical protein RF55_14513 [Lasius niger]
MSTDLRNLLIEQSITTTSIGRVLINFKKLPKANLTLSKTRGRLSNLEALWTRCQDLHVKILQTATAEEQRSASYFLEEDFLAAKDAYLEAADHINDTLGKLTKVETVSSEKEWENFRGIFESLVATNDSLSNTQKLHYLKASLTDEAAILVSNIRVSDANYEAAWRLLVDEFDNQNAIIHAHIHHLLIFRK